MNRLIQLFLKFFHTYKHRIYKISALGLVFLTGCFLSFTTGRRLGQRVDRVGFVIAQSDNAESAVKACKKAVDMVKFQIDENG